MTCVLDTAVPVALLDMRTPLFDEVFAKPDIVRQDTWTWLYDHTKRIDFDLTLRRGREMAFSQVHRALSPPPRDTARPTFTFVAVRETGPIPVVEVRPARRKRNWLQRAWNWVWS
jgi:hypothetical protein